MAKKPNILFFHVDNLGMGELGCYGGGILRGADTKRMDTFAKQGVKLTHYVVEPQCTPTRSALMTGRFPIRSGNHTIALGGNGGGLVTWERTIGSILSEAGYATSIYGKWHIGAEDGRFPTDHGFDEWYGPLRTYDECMWLTDPHYVPERDGFSHMHEGVKGKGCQADHGRAAHHGDQEDLRSGVPEARAQVHGEVRQGRQAVLLLLQPLADALPDVAARRIRRQEHQRRVGRLPVDAGSRFRRAARQARRTRRGRQHHRRDVRRQRRRGSSRRPRHRRLLRRLLLLARPKAASARRS